MASRHQRRAVRQSPPSPRVGATLDNIGINLTLDNNARCPRHPARGRRHHRRTGAQIHVRVRHVIERVGHGRQDRNSLRSPQRAAAVAVAASGGLRRSAVHRLLRRPDRAFGANRAAGEQHYLSNGQGRGPPGRPVQRDPIPAELRRPAGSLRRRRQRRDLPLHHQRCQRGPGRRCRARSTVCSTSPPTPT